MESGHGLVVTDWTSQGGSLYRLVCKVLVEAGGRSGIQWSESLRLPLTEATLKRERLRISVASALLTHSVALLALGGGARLAYIVWKAVEGAL